MTLLSLTLLALAILVAHDAQRSERAAQMRQSRVYWPDPTDPKEDTRVQ